MLTVTIGLDQATAAALTRSGYRLYAFKAVRNSDAAGKVLVWYASDVIGAMLQIAWTPAYAAYVTRSPLDPPDVSATFPVADGQIVKITDSFGSGEVFNGGAPGAVSIQNGSDVQFQAGVAQSVQGAPQPLCAFPLYGGNVMVFTPVEAILLAFSTSRWQLGQAVDYLAAPSPALAALHAASGAMLVDMGASDGAARAVNFDINKGWDACGAAWGQRVGVTTPLASVLILPDA